MPVIYTPAAKRQQQQPEEKKRILGGYLPAAGGILGGLGGGVAGLGIGTAPGAVIGATAGAGAGVALEDALERLFLNRQNKPDEQLKRFATESAMSGGGELLGLGAARLAKPVTQPLARGLMKLSPFFRETGGAGAKAVSRSIASEIPELAGRNTLDGILPTAGRELSEEVLSRSGSEFAPRGILNKFLGKLGITTGRGITKGATEATSELVPGSIANKLRQAIKKLPGTPEIDFRSLLDDSVKELSESRGKDPNLQKAALALLEESNVQNLANKPTWENFLKLKSSLDNVVQGKTDDQIQAIDKLLRKTVADKIRAYTAEESVKRGVTELPQLLADESVMFRLKSAGESALTQSELPATLFELQKAIFRPEIVQPTARAVQSIPGNLQMLSRLGIRSGTEAFMPQEGVGTSSTTSTAPPTTGMPQGARTATTPTSAPSVNQPQTMADVLTPEVVQMAALSAIQQGAKPSDVMAELKLLEALGFTPSADADKGGGAESETAIKLVNSLKNTYADVQSQGLTAQSPDLGRITGSIKGNVAAIRQTSPAAANYKDQTESFMSLLARGLGERGVLTDKDIDRVKKAIPKFSDTPEKAAQGWATVEDILSLASKREAAMYPEENVNEGIDENSLYSLLGQ